MKMTTAKTTPIFLYFLNIYLQPHTFKEHQQLIERNRKKLENRNRKKKNYLAKICICQFFLYFLNIYLQPHTFKENQQLIERNRKKIENRNKIERKKIIMPKFLSAEFDIGKLNLLEIRTQK